MVKLAAGLLPTRDRGESRNPFEGGEVKLFGLLARGKVLSWMASGKYFADLNRLSGPRVKNEMNVRGGFRIEQEVWRDSFSEVELVAIHGGGHALPQSYVRMPKIRNLILGATAEEPNGPAMIWDFFDRQTRR
jgi:polyhydroxybutyrate depolymerase